MVTTHIFWTRPAEVDRKSRSTKHKKNETAGARGTKDKKKEKAEERNSNGSGYGSKPGDCFVT